LSGPLPPPQKSPLWTLGDMLAKAKYVQCSPKASRGYSMGQRQVHCLPELAAPAMKEFPFRTERTESQGPAPFLGHSKPRLDDLTKPGHCDLFMGHKGQLGPLMTGYKPTLGLISLFSKTGVRWQNPKHRSPSHHRCRHSYTNVVHNNIE
jgi:hypothetical protein